MEGRFIIIDGELYHHGIKGMRWGIRRTAEQLGHRIAASRDRRKQIRDEERDRKTRTKAAVSEAKRSSKVVEENGSVLSRKTHKLDDPELRRKQIRSDMKEADDRVKFYGSKRAAKVAIRDEAEYAKSVNRGKAFINTLKYGGGSAAAGITLGALVSAPGPALVGAAAAAAIGLINSSTAARANSFVHKQAKDQLVYTDDSEYGHDLVVAMKKYD